MPAKTNLLVGRDHEVRAIERLLRESAHGASRFLFITGEPGIGKTHLLDELVRQAEDAGCLALEGRAAEFEQSLPFGVVIDALDAYVRSLDAQALDRLAADGLGDLADVLPSLRSLRAPMAGGATAADRFRSYYAVRELLERLAARRPLVLIVDDLHWADQASLELVAHLLRRPPEAAVLVAGSFRSGQADAALVFAVQAALGSPTVEHLELGPLDTEDVGRLLDTVGVAQRDRLHRASGGNPFYLLQLARVPAGGGGARSETPGDQVPPAVQAAIAQELAALPPPARALAEAAAVAGDPFEVDLAAAAAGVGEGAALEALDVLVRRDVVRPTQVPRRFQFRHPLVRTAVYQGASAGTRLAAHGRCAGALAAEGAPATSRAHHVEQSARRGDRVAVDVLIEAARATGTRMPAVAGHWYQAALRLLPEDAGAEERVTLLAAQADALTTGGRLDDARAALLEAIDLVPVAGAGAGGGQLRVRLVAACAGVEQRLGRQEDAHGRLVAGLDQLTDAQSEEGVALMVALAADAFYRIEFQAMEDWGARAVAGAGGIENRPLVAAAHAVHAMGCALIGAVAQAEEERGIAAGLLDAMPDDEAVLRLDTLGHLVGAELYLEHFEATAAHARRGIDMTRAAGQGEVFPTLFPALGTATWVLGRLGESAQVLDEAVESARLSGNAQTLAWALFNRSISALMAGDVDMALAAGEESVEVGRALDDGFLSAHAGIILAAAIIESGDPARGVELLVRAGGGEEIPVVPGGWRAMFLEILALGWLALDRPDDAAVAARRAHEVAELVGLPRPAAVAHRARAAVALAAGDAPTAVAEARASVALAEQASAAVDAAMARVVLGRALAALGDADGAATELEQASAAFDAFGALRHRDRTDQELRRLGRRIHRRSPPGSAQTEGLAALSGRELEVAQLVVDRRTNPEIAAELFLSLKTVETHMRHIFVKLGVSSRVAVARIVERTTPASG